MVMALMAEMSIDTEMVMANWRKNWPTRLVLLGDERVELLAADGIPWQQVFGPGQVGISKFYGRLGVGHGAARLLHLRLVRPRIDLEEHIPLRDQRPFLEVDLVQVTRDAGPQLDGIDRGRPGREVRVVGDLALNGITDRDRRRCSRRHFRGRRGTPRREEEPRDQRGSDGKAKTLWHASLTQIL